MSSASKILARADAATLALRLRGEGKRLVTVNGTFDLFHVGHVAQLEEAAGQGDALFVGVNADASVRQYKGSHRPVLPEQARARVVAALACVTAVVILDEPEAGAAIIALVRPHVHANGAEYGPPSTWVEYPVMERYGVHGVSVERLPGFSTTALMDAVRSGHRLLGPFKHLSEVDDRS